VNIVGTVYMQYKKYSVVSIGRVIAQVEYPSCNDNCWWFSIKVWDSNKGFIKSAQYLTEDGYQFDLIEV